MKFIQKRFPPQELQDFKAKNNPPDWEAGFRNLDKITKEALTKSLIQEQGYLCCYCESRLKYGNCHIEHFRPQSDPTVNSLDYSNLLCSCQVNLERKEPRHCGNLKGDWFDEYLLISPLDNQCESRFIYAANGQILPSQENDQEATTTIEKLGLNLPELIRLRKAVIEEFENLSLEELEEGVKKHLSLNNTGEYGEYWTTVKYLFS